VPSIVFGVFGVGFFIYFVGGTLDRLFFAEALPTPTFGTGGILWASLTLALLTIPVVIVATEEGLAAIPGGTREASLALGATKLETTLRVVLPAVMPSILTGLILAMARAAGEVAPLMITGVVKLAPALMTGNVVIAKPAPTTPLTTLLLGEVAAGIVPAGVLQVLAGGNEIGAALTSHPRVAKISFTGSTATGRKVMESGASGLKRLTLELGGNDAAIVLEDADIAAVAPKIFRAATFNAGQICFAAKRIYAPAGKKYDELCAALVRCANEAIVDNGDKQDTQIGPIQNRPQYEKVLGYLKDAHAKGKVIAGGKPLDREGYFIAPTVVRDIADDSALVREEQFGPIIPVLAYSGLDDVVARANATDYGLGATIWTSNPRAAMELARRLDTGTVWINDFMSMNPGVPMSPARQSGIGVENGMEGLREYMQAHIVSATL